jgi:hypothetical protein
MPRYTANEETQLAVLSSMLSSIKDITYTSINSQQMDDSINNVVEFLATETLKMIRQDLNRRGEVFKLRFRTARPGRRNQGRKAEEHRQILDVYSEITDAFRAFVDRMREHGDETRPTGKVGRSEEARHLLGLLERWCAARIQEGEGGETGESSTRGTRNLEKVRTTT